MWLLITKMFTWPEPAIQSKIISTLSICSLGYGALLLTTWSNYLQACAL